MRFAKSFESLVQLTSACFLATPARSLPASGEQRCCCPQRPSSGIPSNAAAFYSTSLHMSAVATSRSKRSGKLPVRRIGSTRWRGSPPRTFAPNANARAMTRSCARGRVPRLTRSTCSTLPRTSARLDYPPRLSPCRARANSKDDWSRCSHRGVTAPLHDGRVGQS